jgi:hypothetical protein
MGGQEACEQNFKFRTWETLSFIAEESREQWTNGDDSLIKHVGKVQKSFSTEF